MTKIIVISSAVIVALAIGTAVAGQFSKTPVEFYKGHTHARDGATVGAPQHSGGLDRRGCHNASVPYHCH